jgi:hypothetical protein
MEIRAKWSYHSDKSKQIANENVQELTNLWRIILVTFSNEATRREIMFDADDLLKR